MAKNIKLNENWIDKAIAQISPGWAVKRRLAKMQLAVTASYTGASKDKRSLKGFSTTKFDADGDILLELPTLRERSRDLVRNNPLAAGAINTKVTNIVGTGIRLQSWIDNEYLGISDDEAAQWERDVEREFKLWAESPDCDIERTLTFYGLQDLVFRSTLENGDAFVNLPYLERPGSIYDLRIQLIEADRISNPKGAKDTAEIAGGVEKDGYGAPVAYYVQKTHPGTTYSTSKEWDRLPAFGANTGKRNVLHLFSKKRIGQTRGIPDLAPIIEPLKQLGDYTESELSAAAVSALFSVFIKSPDGGGLAPLDPNSGGGGSDEEVKLSPGLMVDLAPGEDIQFANPARPNATFDPFVLAILRQIGVALELPFEILIKHFTASYSAARAAMLEAWRFFSNRRAWLVDNFCQPIYEIWLTEAVAKGRIVAPGFLDGDPAIKAAYLGSRWIGPARGQIDELKEAKAAAERVNLGISTLTEESAAFSGTDWEVLHAQSKKEHQMRLEAGLIQQNNTGQPDNTVNPEEQNK